MTLLVDNFLAHYGVKGMKWGKRMAKADAADAHRSNYEKLNSDLKKLSDSGRGNDLAAVAKANQRYDTERKRIKSDLKSKIKSESGMSKAERKAADKQIKEKNNKDINDARIRQLKRQGDLTTKAAVTYAATSKKGLEAATKAYEKAENKLINGKDAQMAARQTSGERAVSNLAAGLGLASIALSAVYLAKAG